MHVVVIFFVALVALVILFLLYVNVYRGWVRDVRELVERRGWAAEGTLDPDDTNLEIVALFVLLSALLVSSFVLSPTELDSVAFAPSDEQAEVTLDVRDGDTIEFW